MDMSYKPKTEWNSSEIYPELTDEARAYVDKLAKQLEVGLRDRVARTGTRGPAIGPAGFRELACALLLRCVGEIPD